MPEIPPRTYKRLTGERERERDRRAGLVLISYPFRRLTPGLRSIIYLLPVASNPAMLRLSRLEISSRCEGVATGY